MKHLMYVKIVFILSLALSGCGYIASDLSLSKSVKDILPIILSVSADTSNASVQNMSSSKISLNTVHRSNINKFTAEQTVLLYVKYNVPVLVEGIPTIELETGTSKRTAGYISGSGTDTLTFSYLVVAGDRSASLDYTSSTALSLNGGSIRPVYDSSQSTLDISKVTELPPPGSEGSLSQTTPVVINTIPEIKQINTPDTDVYLDGSSLEIVVKYDQTMTVSGAPFINIVVGTNTRSAKFIAKVSASELLFRYDIVIGDNDINGVEIIPNVHLNGGSIINAASENAIIDLPEKDTTGIKTYTSALTASFITSGSKVSDTTETIRIPVYLDSPAPFGFSVTTKVFTTMSEDEFELLTPNLNFPQGSTTEDILIKLKGSQHSTADRFLKLVLAKNSIGTGGKTSIYELVLSPDSRILNSPKVIDFQTGDDFSCALFDDKTLKCFGLNSGGQLANGGYLPQPLASNAPVILSDVESLSVSMSLVCASKTDGTAYCWGHDHQKAISTSALTYFQPFNLGLSDVKKISNVGNVICYQNFSNTLYCWGRDTNGLFGLGVANSNKKITEKVLVANDIVDFKAAMLFYGNSICITKKSSTIPENRDLYCWGWADNSAGNGSKVTSIPATPTATNVVNYHFGLRNLCYHQKNTSNGNVEIYCNGANYFKEITHGQNSAISYTKNFIKMNSSYSDIIPSYDHMCGVKKDDKSLWCWGVNSEIPSRTSVTEPEYKVIDNGIVKLFENTYHNQDSTGRCALLEDSSVVCWQIPLSYVDTNKPNTVMESGIKDVSISPISLEVYKHTCALGTKGEVYCWGKNGTGQIGDRTRFDRTVPIQVLSKNQKKVEVARERSCAISTFGELRCWGYQNKGSMGSGNINGTSSAVHTYPIPIIASGVKDISLNEVGGCAIVNDGELHCWGDNAYKTVDPNDSANYIYAPRKIINSGVKFVKTFAYNICIIKDDDKLYCWGDNDYYQLGDGTIQSKLEIPSEPILEGVESVEIGGSAPTVYMCALLKDKSMKCWGSTKFRSPCLGFTSTTPAHFTHISEVQKLSIGNSNVCAITGNERKLLCWGLDPSIIGEGTNPSTGQLSPRCFDQNQTPFEVEPSNVESVKTVFGATCYTTTAGELKCLGKNDFDILGLGASNPFPRIIPGL